MITFPTVITASRNFQKMNTTPTQELKTNETQHEYLGYAPGTGSVAHVAQTKQ